MLFVQGRFFGNAIQTNAVFFGNIQGGFLNYVRDKIWFQILFFRNMIKLINLKGRRRRKKFGSKVAAIVMTKSGFTDIVL